LARKADAEADSASKAILDQLQTKTAGPPPASTGLVGDLTPESVFSVDDYDQVKNQITLQLSNLEVLNVLNTIGQVTNTQSQSGPIQSTLQVRSATIPDKAVANRQTLHRPDPGQVWRCIALSATWALDSNPTFVVQVGDPTGSVVTCIETTVTANSQTTLGEPLLNEITTSGTREGGWNPDIHYDYTNPLMTFFSYSGSTITTAPTVVALVVRVR